MIGDLGGHCLHSATSRDSESHLPLSGESRDRAGEEFLDDTGG